MTDRDIVEPSADEVKGQRKLRGWLLVFVIWLGVVGPAYSICLNAFFALRWHAMLPQTTSYFTSWGFLWFMAAREGSRIAAAIVLVSRRSADAIWFAIVILWLSGPLLVTVTWMQFGTIVMPSALVRSGAIAAAATLYLLRSRQVRTVYGFEAFKSGSPVLAMEREQPTG